MNKALIHCKVIEVVLIVTSTLDLSEFNVDVMTGNNGAYQRSPYDPVIQKLPFLFVQTPELFFTSMELMI